MKTLFFTCWVPTKENPIKGIFIEAHRRCIIDSGIPLTSLSLDISAGNKFFEKYIEIKEPNTPYENHIIYIRSRYHKLIYSIPYFSYLLSKSYIRKEFSHKEFDLIHSNILFPCGIAGYYLSKKFKTKHLLTEHWSKVDHFLNHHLFKFQGSRTLNRLDALTVVSDFLAAKISPFLKSGISLRKVPNCLDAELFGCSKNFDSGVIRFVAIATWKNPKLPHLFIEALNKISAHSDLKFELNIVGDGPLISPYKKASFENLSINFHGFRKNTFISQLLSECHFLVHASSVETFSVVIAEGLMSGLPVIASNVGAIPELINPQNGVLSDNSPESWVSAIKQAMNVNFNRSQIKTEATQKFNSTRIGSLFNSIYRNIIQK